MNRLSLLWLLLSAFSAQAQTPAQETTAPVEQPPVPPADVNASREEIELAYKKEYAFLTGQVDNIQTRIDQFKREAVRDKSALENEIVRLENQLLGLEQQSRQLSDDVFEVQRASESAQDNTGLLKATIQQATATLSEFDTPALPNSNEETGDLARVQGLVQAANQLLADFSSVHLSDGAFYLSDGTEVNGRILKVGHIAAYGHAPGGTGALAPAGEGQLKMWPDQDHAAVQALFDGRAPASLPVFLFESTLKGIEEKQQKTVLSVIDSGGIIAWIIAGLGVLATLLIALRFWFLKKSSASTEKLLGKVVSRIESRQMEEAVAVAHTSNSASARVLASALRNLDRDRDHIEDIVSESILHESALLNRFGSLILVIATVSPLLGLLGTVTGMISTFDIITEFGTGDPKLLSGGISIALVTTEVGLAVAIPALLFGNLLSGWAERIKDDMEKAALRVINVYQKVVA